MGHGDIEVLESRLEVVTQEVHALKKKPKRQRRWLKMRQTQQNNLKRWISELKAKNQNGKEY